MLLNELLRLERPLHVFDLETTSLDTKTARIVEIGFQTWTAEGLKHEWRSLVNPGIPILNTANHHVTDDDVTLKCWRCRRYLEEHPGEDCPEWKPVPRFGQIAGRIAKRFSDCDFAGKNIRYDIAVMTSEMKREGVPWSYAGAAIIDADRLEALGEPRKLADLYKKHTGQDMQGAHEALADVRGTTVIIASQLQKYKVLPRDIRLLHEMQWPGWITSMGEFRFDKEGVARCQFGKHREQDVRRIPRDYWKWMLTADFPSDVHKLAEDALKNVFPHR